MHGSSEHVVPGVYDAAQLSGRKENIRPRNGFAAGTCRDGAEFRIGRVEKGANTCAVDVQNQLVVVAIGEDYAQVVGRSQGEVGAEILGSSTTSWRRRQSGGVEQARQCGQGGGCILTASKAAW